MPSYFRLGGLNRYTTKYAGGESEKNSRMVAQESLPTETFRLRCLDVVPLQRRNKGERIPSPGAKPVPSSDVHTQKLVSSPDQ